MKQEVIIHGNTEITFKEVINGMMYLWDSLCQIINLLMKFGDDSDRQTLVNTIMEGIQSRVDDSTYK